MADIPDVVTVFVIAGVVGPGAGNVQLQIGFQFGKIQFRVADFLFVLQIGGGEERGLDAGEHGGTGGQSRREKGDHQRQRRHNEQRTFVRRRELLNRPDDLPGGGYSLLGVLGGLLGLLCGLGIFTLDFLLLNPLGEGIFAPQIRVIPEGGLPCGPYPGSAVL